MDIPLCTSAVYSENYINLIFKSESELPFISQRTDIDCVTTVTNRYGVAYKRVGNGGTYNLDEVTYENIPKCYGLTDESAVQDTGADRLVNLPGLGVTGKDVLIGFVDTGIDYRSPAFFGSSGTRIRYIWDQNMEVMGTGEAVFGFGAEYTKEMIDEAIASEDPYSIVPSFDDNGHGTLLASIAAGRVNEGQNFRGMAPEAELMVVNLKQAKKNLRDFYFIREDAECYGEDDILLGVRYLMSKAASLGRPLVLCIGLGTSQGNHNGTTTLENFFMEYLNLRGFCAVTSVGNELGYGGHYQSSNAGLEANGSERIEISVGSGSRGFSAEVWGKAPVLIKVSVVSPTGERFSNIPYLRDGSTTGRFLYEGTKVYASNSVVNDISGDQLVLLRFEYPTEGIWIIEVEEYSQNIRTGFDAWLQINQFLDADIRFVRPEPNVTICSPGNGRGLISVAGYNHRNNAIYFRSSRGYTRAGFIEPDITAPAVDVQGVFATLSDRELYTRGTGTSVAAAITAGAAALLMDWGVVQDFYPVLTTEIIRQMFIRGVRYVNDMSYPNRIWGYGVLDLFNTFENLRT